MATLRITKKIKAILKPHFIEVLLEDASKDNILQVNYSQSTTNGFKSSSYSVLWAQYAKIINDAMIKQGVDSMGAWTRKSNKPLLAKIESLVLPVTAAQILAQRENRFKTWAD